MAWPDSDNNDAGGPADLGARFDRKQPMAGMQSPNPSRKRHILLGLVVSAALGVQCHQLSQSSAGPTPSSFERISSAAVLRDLDITDPNENYASARVAGSTHSLADAAGYYSPASRLKETGPLRLHRV